MGNKAAVATVKVKADRHAENVLPIIEDIWNAGTQTLGGIATALNERRSRASWHAPARVWKAIDAPPSRALLRRGLSASKRRRGLVVLTVLWVREAYSPPSPTVACGKRRSALRPRTNRYGRVRGPVPAWLHVWRDDEHKVLAVRASSLFRGRA